MSAKDYSLLAGNMLLMHELAAVLRECSDAGIRVILLKGAAMLAAGLAGEDERTMSDIDVLVRPQDLETFIGLITRSGYQRIGDSFRDYSKKPEDPLVLVALDIHTELWHARKSELLWDDARPAEVEGVPALTLSLEGMVLHCISHAILHSACLDERARGDLRRFIRSDLFSWERLKEKSDGLGMGVLVKPVLSELGAPGSIIRGLKVESCHKPWYPFFSQAARRRKRSHFFEYLLPVFFRPSLAWAAAFPGKETIVARYGADSIWNRAKRPFQLLRKAFQ